MLHVLEKQLGFDSSSLSGDPHIISHALYLLRAFKTPFHSDVEVTILFICFTFFHV